MSGAAGHLPHLHENRNLTFGELKDVLTRAAEGRLDEVFEKFDGMNLVFTWDVVSRDVRVARSGSDIESGGMTPEMLDTKFRGRNVAKAFNQAFQVLRQVVNSLSSSDLVSIFGDPAMQYWYSIEIVYPSGANTINYDSNCIIFHRTPVFARGFSTTRVENASGVEALASRVESMQKAITMRGWRVMGPAMVKLRNITDGNALEKALRRIDEAIAPVHINDDQTINDYLLACAIDQGIKMGLNAQLAADFARRMTNQAGAPNVVALSKRAPKYRDKIADLVSQDKQLLARWIMPIENAISNFAQELLDGMSSVLINDPDKEIARLRDEVDYAIDELSNTGWSDEVEDHLYKMGGVKKITSAMEGIVFIFKGKAYKMTGSWAPAHQILSLYKRTESQRHWGL